MPPAAPPPAAPPPAGGYAPRQEPEPIPAARSAGTAAERSEAPRARRPRRPEHSPQAAAERRQSSAHPPAKPARRPRRKRRILPWILAVLLILLLTPVGMLFYYDAKLDRVDALAPYAGRPAASPGTTWLIVGTDSREGLSQAERDQLSAGDAEGARTDTIMLAHLPPRGKPMLISVPRDLYVPIPGLGSHKINAAFNQGGPQLLVQTIEGFTGLRIDHYVEVGFGGFDTLVDAVGGVQICLDQPLRDPMAGLNLKAGCQQLNGRQALGLVRTRAFPNADLQRVINQRKFLTALMARASSPAVLLNPFRLIPFLNGATAALTVAEGDHLWDLGWLAFRLRGDSVTTTVPTGGSQYTDDGDSLTPDDDTASFFDYLRRGQTVPEELLTDNTGPVS